MKEKICSFCGHRDADSSLRSQIKTAVTDLIENNGITTFYSGGMGAFDGMCESVVRELKRAHPLKLYLIAPYMTQKINRDGKYYKELYDDIIIPDLGEVHYKRAITERNKWMVRESDVILCYVTHSCGGAYQMLQYARKLNKTIAKYGKRGITEYDLTDGIAEISDDTQMSLFTATGLLFGTTRGKMRGIMGSYPSYINGSYLDWLKTQCECYPLKKEFHYSWLVNIPEMFSSRAPGNTCMSALSKGGNGTIEEPINNSKGCGGIMRVAPIGIYFNDRRYSVEEIDMIGAETAALTHGHELGYIPAAALVHIINQITEKKGVAIQSAVLDSLEMMKKMFPNAKHMSDFVALIAKAVELAGKNIPDIDAITQLGEGWVAEETLAIAVYCAIKYSDDFDKGIITAVNHSGDSDSTGAVAGNILGAYLGYDAIPMKYKKNLELHNLIIEIAEDLFDDCQMSEYGEYRDETWKNKYINMSYIL